MVKHQAFIATVLCLCAFRASGHAFIKIPAARNVLANSDYCPQCLSAGGPFAVSTSGKIWPDGNHGLCGDPYSTPAPRNHEAGGKYWTGKITETYVEGQVIKLSTTVTAYHKGLLGFRICKISGGTITNETAQLTESCFDKNILKQANVAGAPSPGSRYFDIGVLPPSSITASYDADYQLPPGLTCDGVTSRCVLQFYYLTGNSCAPPGTANVGGLSTCGAFNAPYPEEFWNCADIAISSAPSSSPQPSPVSSPPLPSPKSSPPPPPVATKSPPPVVATSPPPVKRSPPPPVATKSPPPSPTSTSPSPSTSPTTAAVFCATKSPGSYADRSSGCRSYFVCDVTGSFYMACPSNLLYNEAIKACDWDYNVKC